MTLPYTKDMRGVGMPNDADCIQCKCEQANCMELQVGFPASWILEQARLLINWRTHFNRCEEFPQPEKMCKTIHSSDILVFPPTGKNE